MEYPSDTIDAARALWIYHTINDEVAESDVGIGFGSHDIGVAVRVSELFTQGLFPLVIFSGANAPTTVDVFPRGEAVHYAEYAQTHGVPRTSILVEPRATNTAENVRFSRALLEGSGRSISSAILVSRPYQQRRVRATFHKEWPGVEVRCTAQSVSFESYLELIGDPSRVLNMLVGDTQRIWLYAEKGFAAPEPVPDSVRRAYEFLVSQGFTSRVVRE